MIVPRFTQEQCLILTDADAESLLATAMASEQQSISSTDPSMLIPAWWGANDTDLDLVLSALEPAARKHADIFGLQVLAEHAIYPPESSDPSPISLHANQTRMLFDAAYLAIQLGLKRLVWPVRIPMNHPDRIKGIGDALDRAMLVSRLVSIDADESTAPEIIIETPFIDLTDAQIADLAMDLAIPLESCWWASAQDLPLAQSCANAWQGMNALRSSMLEPKPGVKTPS